MPRKNANVAKVTKSPTVSKAPDRVTTITNTLFEHVKRRGETVLYPALRKRLNDLTSEVTDLDEIELVCLTIIDDSIDFAAWKNLAWTSYEYMKETLEVPDGAWKYALWAYRLPSGKIQESVNYWLGIWYDAIQNDEEYQRDRAKNQLDNLWSTHVEKDKEIKW